MRGEQFSIRNTANQEADRKERKRQQNRMAQRTYSKAPRPCKERCRPLHDVVRVLKHW